MDDRLKKQIEFIIEADKMKTVLRQTVLIDQTKRENDAEHSWHFALCAMVLYEYCDTEHVNLFRVLKMALIHDIIEIYAGDTFAYDDKANIDKAERENAAADKVFGLLPDDQREEYRALWEEFDAMETDDALFAAGIDRLQPLINNYLTGGHTWKLGDVPSVKVYKRIEPLKKSAPKLWEFADMMVKDSLKKGFLKL